MGVPSIVGPKDSFAAQLRFFAEQHIDLVKDNTEIPENSQPLKAPLFFEIYAEALLSGLFLSAFAEYHGHARG